MRKLIIDSFAGGGGTSCGIEMVFGRSPDVAINHDHVAMVMHEHNHPDTLHLEQDVWKLDLHKITKGRPIGLLTASPDCTHFSRARGSKPVRKRIRGLAWVVCRWARDLKPDVIILENVREFADYGPTTAQVRCGRCRWSGTYSSAKLYRTRPACPECNSVRLDETGYELPDPTKKGLTFRRWVGYLMAAGYDVQWRDLNAADYGSPTNRHRLFVVARRDGKPICWPEPSHCNPKKSVAGRKSWRGACECIDFTLPCPSIFTRSRGPLAEKTMRRIACGIKRYVLENPKPFIVQVAHGDSPGSGDRVRDIDLPLGTVLQSNNEALVSAVLMPLTHSGDRRTPEVTEPLPTITTAHRGEFGLVTAFLAKHFGGVVGTEVTNPLPTTTQRGTQTQLVAASLLRYYGKSVGQQVTEPAPTATGENKTALLAATLVQTGYGERDGQAPRTLDLEAPLGTVVAGGGKHALAAAALVHFNHGDKQWSDIEDPLRTITSGNHAALVYGLLLKWFGTSYGQSIEDPIGTLTSRDRYGLVLVHVAGEPYVIVDIGMRMLTPRELASCQGFPEDYWLPPVKTHAVAKIGNSVPPQLAAAVIRANFVETTKQPKAKARVKA